MCNLNWRAKLNQSMDLARIHPIIEVLAQGSYRFESLSVMNTDRWFVKASTDGLEEA